MPRPPPPLPKKKVGVHTSQKFLAMPLIGVHLEVDCIANKINISIAGKENIFLFTSYSEKDPQKSEHQFPHYYTYM